MVKIWNRMHATRYPGASHASPLLPAQHDTPPSSEKSLRDPGGACICARALRFPRIHARTHARTHKPIERVGLTDKRWQTGKPSFHHVDGCLVACLPRLCGLAAWDGWHGMGWDACLAHGTRLHTRGPVCKYLKYLSWCLGTIRDCGPSPRLCENGNGLSRRWSRPPYLPLPAIARLGTRVLLSPTPVRCR